LWHIFNVVFFQRKERAVESVKHDREYYKKYSRSHDVENKIRRIGGANLHPSAQFDNLHKLFLEVNTIALLFIHCLNMLYAYLRYI
jgi:hypothetical protein